MGKLTINELAQILVERKKLSKSEANDFVGKLFDVVQQAVERDRLVKVKGLGTFKLIDVEPRESVNVNTGERVLIEGHDKITFVPDTIMKELVNKPFSQFETVVLNDGVAFSDTPEETKPMETPVATEPINHDEMPLVDFGAEEVEEHPMLEIPEEPEMLEIPEEPEMLQIPEEPETEPIPEPEPEILEPVFVPEPEPEISEPVFVPEPEPEPVFVPEEPVFVPESEPEPIPEVETVAAPELLIPEEEEIEEQQVEAQDTPESPKAQDISEESEISESSQVQDVADEADTELFDEETEEHNSWLKWLGIFLLGLIAGYLIGNYLPIKSFLGEGTKPSEPVVEEQTAQPVVIDSTAVGDTLSVKTDTITAPAADAAEPAEKPAAKPEAPAAKAAETAAKAEEPLDPYAAKDNRVRLGAYRITGTDKVVKAKEGETISKISRHYLGPDMECYVEVYNDMKASDVLKAGQEVKIPKLQWKKKKAN